MRGQEEILVSVPIIGGWHSHRSGQALGLLVYPVRCRPISLTQTFGDRWTQESLKSGGHPCSLAPRFLQGGLGVPA